MSIKALVLPLILAALPLTVEAASGGAFRAGAFSRHHGIYHHGGYYRGGYCGYSCGNNFDACNAWRDGKLACSSSIVIPDSTYDCNGWSCARTYCSNDCVWF